MRLKRLFEFVKNCFAGNHKKTELSFSRIKTYIFCPLKFKLIYEQGWKEKLNAQSSLGLSLHRALEQFHQNREVTLDALYGYLDEQWVNKGFASAQDSYETYEHSRNLLGKYFEQWSAEKAEIIFVEKNFSFEIGGVRLQGIIDRIDKTPDGEYEVIDYKTRVRPRDRDSGYFSLQLGIYYLAAERILGKAPKRIMFYCLTSGERYVKSFTEKDRDNLARILEQTAKLIARKKYAPNLEKCQKCDFMARCPKK